MPRKSTTKRSVRHPTRQTGRSVKKTQGQGRQKQTGQSPMERNREHTDMEED